MFIFEDFGQWEDMLDGGTYFIDVFFKDAFLKKFQTTLEQFPPNLVLFGNKVSPKEIVDLLGRTHETLKVSQCNVCDCISEKGYFQVMIFIKGEETPAMFEVHWNLINESKPTIYLTQLFNN